MKKKLGNRGFALLETLVIIMILTCMASVFYGIAGMRHRMVIGRVQEEEAYYAALSAVRMMAGEVAEGNAEWTSEDGVERIRTEIEFLSDDTNEEIAAIPVEVWSERNGDELLLSAEAAYGRKTKKIVLELRLESMGEDLSVEDDLEKATMSNAALADNLVWKPVGYRIEG